MRDTNNNSKKEYAAVDIAKMFFCLCILFRHTGAYHEIPYSWYIQHGIFCLSVPFFFVVSGYFFGCKAWQKDDQTLFSKILAYEKRLFYPYLVFSIINSTFAGISMYAEGESIKWTLFRLAKAAIFYPYGALWYIWASMTGMLLLYWFIRHDHMELALFLGLLGYSFALLCNSYYSLLDFAPDSVRRLADTYLRITTSARNGLFVGFILLGIGITLAKYQKYLFQTKAVILSLILLSVSSISLFFEIRFIENRTVADDHSLFISQLILIPALLILLLNCRMQGSRNLLLLRKMSTGFYFIHRPLLTCLTYILPVLGFSSLSGITLFFILVILCTIICLPTYLSQKGPLYKLLK